MQKISLCQYNDTWPESLKAFLEDIKSASIARDAFDEDDLCETPLSIESVLSRGLNPKKVRMPHGLDMHASFQPVTQL